MQTNEECKMLSMMDENILEHFPCAVYKIKKDFTFLYMNKAARNSNGFYRNLMPKEYCYKITGNEKICKGCPVEKALQTQQVEKHHKCKVCQDQRVVVLEQTAIPVFTTNGDIDYILEVDMDITTVLYLQQENEANYVQTIFAFAKLIEERDIYTGKHSENVHDIAMQIGKSMKLQPEELVDLSSASLLHDIGKIGIPEDILMKPGRLTREERKKIEKHPLLGYDVLIKIKRLHKIAEYVLCHHERVDGKGYPNQRKEDKIPLIARILSVADVFEALTARRIYRAPLPLNEVINFMKAGKGVMFSPHIVDCLLNLLVNKKLSHYTKPA